ncbi:C2H2-type domain-containing protein [Aphis craccivora]|uniref:C2H2-type domain-containing protein n=1 Tax=Aphis craccivora TaxID=307492 RepID=A0A6G0VXJ9_APHCR|nr:C2H2-type domain-containing protein [Aphis craccivora]
MVLCTSISTYTCKESKCNKSFQSLSSFRKHIQNKHISIENTVHVTTLNTSITASNHNNSGTDFQINVVEPVKNYCNSDQPTSKRPKSNDNVFNINKCIETLHLNAVQFCLNLHNNNNFCKSDVVNIQDDIINKIINPITELIKGTIENEIKDTIILSTFSKLTLAISDIFKFCNTEHLLNNWLKNNELISNQFKQFTINNEINIISHNGQTVYDKVSTKDDVEINNPLGSKSMCHSISAIYYSFSLNEQSSRLDNIFLAALIKSKDLKMFGNDLCFMKLVDEINSLENDGIMIDTPEGSKTVYFILGLLVGDNLGVNSICEFSKSFSANFFCRFCKAPKQLTHSLSHEDSTLLRNIDNYTEDVLKNDFSQTGIYKESVLNRIQSFHVTTNFSIDVMHDIFEVGDLIPEHDEIWQFFLNFLEIIEILLGHQLTQQGTVSHLKNLISKHNTDYILFFQHNLKPKHHLLTHYPSIILKSGPPRNFWCFRYEAKHKEFKMYARAITSRKNICLTLANKYQFKFAHFLLSQKYDYLEINISKSQKVSLNDYDQFIFNHLNISTDSFNSYSKINFKGTTYKTGNYLTSFINEICLYEILAIIILKNDDIYFVVNQIQLEWFNSHLRSYEVDRNKAVVSKSNIVFIKNNTYLLTVKMDPGKNIFETFIEEEVFREYTELQSNNNQSYNSIENHSVVDNEYTPIEPEITNYTSTSDLSLTQNAFCLTINDKMQLKSTLEDWNMGYLYQTCVAESIDIQALNYISTDQISQLLSKYPLGVKIFEHYVMQWREN